MCKWQTIQQITLIVSCCKHRLQNSFKVPTAIWPVWKKPWACKGIISTHPNPNSPQLTSTNSRIQIHFESTQPMSSKESILTTNSNCFSRAPSSTRFSSRHSNFNSSNLPKVRLALWVDRLLPFIWQHNLIFLTLTPKGQQSTTVKSSSTMVNYLSLKSNLQVFQPNQRKQTVCQVYSIHRVALSHTKEQPLPATHMQTTLSVKILTQTMYISLPVVCRWI